MGIDNARYNILLFTDVDCRVKKNWVSGMAKYFRKNDYVIGFSEIKNSDFYVSKFQNIDFKMLMFAALGSALNGSPMACSGQNQAYKKSIYNKMDGFNSIKHLLQGDDSIFLQLCRKKSNINICFSENKGTHVQSKKHIKWKNFILQRIRWAGDANIMWKYNKLFFLIIISTFLANLLTPILIIQYYFFNQYFLLIMLLISMKLFFEFFIYYKGCYRLNKKIEIYSFLLWFVIQPFYIVLVGILSFFSTSFSWRDRPSN